MGITNWHQFVEWTDTTAKPEGDEREWLTFNRAPGWWPEEQGSLF